MRRIRSQSGYTVVEMLVAMMVLALVVAGALTFVQVIMRQGRGVLDRTDAAQHGRLALDQLTRQVRSQVCKNETTKGLIDASPTKLTFYADMSSGEDGAVPVKRQLEFKESEHRIYERVYAADGTTVLRNRVLLQDVWPSTEPTPDLPTSGPPKFFRYRAYPTTMTGAPSPSEVLTGTPLSPASVARIARIDINFVVHPTGARPDTKISTPLSDAVVLRNADPNATTGDPTCI